MRLRRAKLEPHELDADSRWELVQRILASAPFQKSPRMRDLLRHICEQTLAGHPETLTEAQIGVAVFGKPETYSPSEDNSVRAQARQLRLKLLEYFDTAGISEPIVLDIPKGGYVPAFHPREAGLQEMHGLEPAAAAEPVQRRSRWVAVLAVLSAVLLAVAAWLLVEVIALRAQVAQRAQQEQRSGPAWPVSMLLPPGRTARIVVADTAFALIAVVTGARPTLDDYTRPDFPYYLLPPKFQRMDYVLREVREQYSTSFAETAMAACLIRLSGTAMDRLSVGYARNVGPRELEQGNHILIGSSATNPWVSLYSRQLDFETHYDASMVYFLNKKPRPGEPQRFVATGKTGQPGDDYVSISMFPKESGNGLMMLIQGLKQEGTEAAAAFLSTEANRLKLARAVGYQPGRPGPERFEVLLRTRTLAGGPTSTTIVAAHAGD